MGDARKLFIGDTLATHCAIAALARELLLQNGSEVFVRAEQQAKNFVTRINLESPPSIRKFGRTPCSPSPRCSAWLTGLRIASASLGSVHNHARGRPVGLKLWTATAVFRRRRPWKRGMAGDGGQSLIRKLCGGQLLKVASSRSA